jgi:tetratricopeptide (TPR) repeat protein
VSPTPTTDPAQVANTVVTWSGFVLAGFSFLIAVITTLLVLAGIFGLRELRGIRKAREEISDRVEATLQEANELLGQLRAEVAGIDDRMNSVVEVSYLFNQGELAYRDGEYAKAVGFLGRAAVLDPRNARVSYRLGRALTNLGDEIAAAQRFKEMQELDTVSGDAERGLALVYRYSDPGGALRYAQRAVEVSPHNHSNLNCLGLILRDSGDIAGASAAHEKAAGLSGDSAVTPFFLALLRAHQRATERAVVESRTAAYRVDQQQQLAPVKSLWAEIIRWAERVLAADYETADKHVLVLTEICTSRRRAREIGGHMAFLLRALEREPLLERFLGPIEKRWPPRPGE